MSLGHRIVEGVSAAGFQQRPAQSAVMAHIDVAGGSWLTTIAARANITPQPVGELVDDLERLGYVVRQPDPDDRRAKRIVLTDRGRESVAAALDTLATLEAELEDLLGADKLGELHDSLGRILTTIRPSKTLDSSRWRSFNADRAGLQSTASGCASSVASWTFPVVLETPITSPGASANSC